MRTMWICPVLYVVSIALVTSAIGAKKEGPISANTHAVESVESTVQVPDDMRWEPSWRDKGDCGPLCLYVLMQLDDRRVSVEDVKKVVLFDPEAGCSLAEISRGADALGFATEVRFVNPQDLPSIPSPFIVHTTGSLQRGTGHFLLVVGYSPEKRQYAAIDTTYELFRWQTEESLLTAYSGYVLVPKSTVVIRWRHIASFTFICIGCVLVLLTVYRSPLGIRAFRKRV